MSKSSVKFSQEDVSKEISNNSRKIVESFARLTEAQVKKNIIRSTPTGNTYQVPGTSVSYTASSPGEAPANRTGALANSYATEVISDKEAIVFSNLKYAKIEFGFGNIAPRPALRPARDQIMKDKDKIIKSAIKGKGK